MNDPFILLMLGLLLLIVVVIILGKRKKCDNGGSYSWGDSWAASLKQDLMTDMVQPTLMSMGYCGTTRIQQMPMMAKCVMDGIADKYTVQEFFDKINKKVDPAHPFKDDMAILSKCAAAAGCPTPN